MLVLSRQSGEAIVIGDGIEIHVVSVGRNGVRIGVTAPRDIPVHRREVYDLVVAANRTAATSASGAVGALASALRNRKAAQAPVSEERHDAPDRLA